MPIKDKDAYNAYQRTWYSKKIKDETFRKKLYKRKRGNDVRYRQKNKDVVSEFRKDGCRICQEDIPCCLCAHHLDPASKEFDVGMMVNRYCHVRLEAELKKCVCLCHNCHAKLHAGIISLVV